MIFKIFKDQTSHLGGPVDVFLLGATLARNKTAALLEFAAVVSMNLAVINVLIPPTRGTTNGVFARQDIRAFAVVGKVSGCG